METIIRSQNYKNTTKLDLLEMEFSFHEDNLKVKEMTEVTSYCMSLRNCLLNVKSPDKFGDFKIIFKFTFASKALLIDAVLQQKSRINSYLRHR